MKKIVKSYPRKRTDVPVTQTMLFGVRKELKEDIKGVRTELKAEIQNLRTEVKAEIQTVRTELKAEIQTVRTELKAEIQTVRTELKAEIQTSHHGLKSEIHRLGVLIEEQNARNVIVLDALTGVMERQDRMESEHADFRKLVMGLK